MGVSMRTKPPDLAERMLDTAAKLFGSKRFHEVRMEDVAAEAHVSKGTLYRYFRDKDEMYLALLGRASDQLIELLCERVGQADGARAGLVALVDSVVMFFDDNPHVFDLIQRAEALRGPGEAFPWQPVRDEGVRLVGEVFQQARDRGEFTVGEPDLVALMLLGGMRAVVRFAKKPRPSDLAQRIVDNFLWGVASRSRLPSGT